MDSSAFHSYGSLAILVVEDHRAVRQALRELLHLAFGAIDVLEAASVAEALRHVRERHVDIVLMDIRLPGGDGIGGVRQVLEHSPHSRIVMVSNLDDTVHRGAAARAGAKEFVSKRAIGKELVPAIERLLDTRCTDVLAGPHVPLGEELWGHRPAPLAMPRARG